jgi:hypothetical protein
LPEDNGASQKLSGTQAQRAGKIPPLQQGSTVGEAIPFKL